MDRLSARRIATGFSLGGSLLTGIAIFLPWWELHSNVVNGQLALFDFTIGLLGISINTAVGDPRILLAPLEILYLAVTIALLPISSSLALEAFNGVYCFIRKRTGVRLLIAPIWGVIALSWWTYYFLLVYHEFSRLGLNIPVTGSADIRWGSYSLIGADWGWGPGFYLSIAGTIVLAAGAGLTIRSTPRHKRPTDVVGLHSIGLLILAAFNLVGFVLVLPLVGAHNSGAAVVASVPTVLLFAMAFLARRPKALQTYRNEPVTSIPLSTSPLVPTQNLPIDLRPSNQERPCSNCGKGLPEGSLFCPACGSIVNSPYSINLAASAGHIASPAPQIGTSTINEEERFCNNCGKVIPADSFFCPTCGANLNLSQSKSPTTMPPSSPTQEDATRSQTQRRYCFTCGKEIPEESLFCPTCGVRVS